MTKRYVGKRDDLRVQKTKRAIRDAAIELMRENPGRLPSAKAIIEAAQINKSTFYYHYPSVQDLFDQLEQELFDKVMREALESTELLAEDPAAFLQRFAAFAYAEPAAALSGNARVESSALEALVGQAATPDGPAIDPHVLETVLLGLWGLSRRIGKDEFTAAIPSLARFIQHGIAAH